MWDALSRVWQPGQVSNIPIEFFFFFYTMSTTAKSSNVVEAVAKDVGSAEPDMLEGSSR